MMRLELLSTTDVSRPRQCVPRRCGSAGSVRRDRTWPASVSVQWQAGAGDGAIARGKRVQTRDIDLPLYFRGTDRANLQDLLSRLARMLDGECTLRLVEEDGSDWSTQVWRVGGGDVVYGVDTIGESDLRTVITLRAGDPYFTYSRASVARISNSGAGRGLVGTLSALRVSSSQAIGTITLENPGDAKAYPVWEVQGPGEDFVACSADGAEFWWTGVLGPGQKLTVDTKTASVVDHTGANRYADLAPAPRFGASRPASPPPPPAWSTRPRPAPSPAHGDPGSGW